MKILIAGYYGFGNAGDELILDVLIKNLKNREKDSKIVVLSDNPEETSINHNISSISRWNPLNLLKSLKDSDIVIVGGGGLFQDMTSNLSLYYYLSIIWLAKIFKKKIFVCAVSINELSGLNKILMGYVLKQADRITVRENESKDFLVKIGCPEGIIEVTADIVFLKEINTGYQAHRNRKIAFILRAEPDAGENGGVFAELADFFIESMRSEVMFIPFHMEEDQCYIKGIMNRMKNKSVLVRWKNPDEIIAIFQEVGLVVSQRLHGLILSALNGIPFLGLSGDSKITRFLKEFEQKKIYRNSHLSSSEIKNELEDTWSKRENISKKIHSLLPAFKSRAQRNFQLLFESIK
ncbi:MAG: polysaccharide pyruvyl transferase CsaB [Endomicrobiales bacterium]|nr:polysaccharide pyruvyl transferase CsaB [Endomicrobiales bacterium]